MKKAVAIIFVLLLVTNLVLFIVNAISVWLFWGIIIISALVAYKVIPRFKKP